MKKLSMKKFNTLLNERSVLNSKIKELEEQVKERENTIKEFMEYNGLEEYSSELYKVTYVEVISNLFDKSKFIKQYGEDIYKQYTKESSKTPFHVYPIKK